MAVQAVQHMQSARRQVGATVSATSFASTSLTYFGPGIDLMTMVVFNYIAAGSPTTPTVSGWTRYPTQSLFGSNNPNDSLWTMFYRISDGATRADVIDFGGVTQDQIFFCMNEWRYTALSNGGADAFPGNVKASNAGNVTSLSDSLPNALADPGSMLFVAVSSSIQQTATAGSGFVLSSNFSGSVQFQWSPEYKSGVTAFDESWGSGTNIGYLAFEIMPQLPGQASVAFW